MGDRTDRDGLRETKREAGGRRNILSAFWLIAESFQQSFRPTENTALRNDAFAIEIEAVDGAGDLIQFDACAGDFQRPSILNTLVTETIEFRGFNISVRAGLQGRMCPKGRRREECLFSGSHADRSPTSCGSACCSTEVCQNTRT